MIQVGDKICVFPEHSRMVVRVDDPVHQQTVGALPTVARKGNLYQVPWSIGTCRFFYNLGFTDALDAAPISFEQLPLVEGKYPMMAHQRRTAAFMSLFGRGYILSEPRTGKTGAAIIALDYLQRIHAITGGVLIITTLTTMHGVWKENILATLPGARVQVVHGKTRAKDLETPADFYSTNYDSVRLSEKAFVKAIETGRIGAIVIDEMTHVGNSASQRHKAIYNICNKYGVKYVWGLTGSPADNPEMVFGMCRTVNPDKLPCTTKSAWINLTTYQYGPQPYMRAVARGASEVIRNAMQPAIRFAKKDILDLPPVTTQARTCELSAEQRTMRNELKTQATALLESGERITAANGGVLMNKLMQVALGVVRGDNREAVILDHRERTQAILDAIEETNRKVVIFCGYTAGIRMLVDEISKAGYTCDMVDGSVTGTKRAQILHDFQYEKDPRVLVCHPTTTAMGVELSAADTMIFDGVPLTGGFVYAQSIERLSSAKQTASSINIIHIVSTPEERKALAALQKGYDLGQEVAKMFEDFAHE